MVVTPLMEETAIEEAARANAMNGLSAGPHRRRGPLRRFSAFTNKRDTHHPVVLGGVGVLGVVVVMAAYEGPLYEWAIAGPAAGVHSRRTCSGLDVRT